MSVNKSDCIDHGQKGNADGYGRCRYNCKMKLAHRVRYVERHGLQISDIDGKVVLHICDNPRCINVDHLKLGTVRDNIQDRVAKGRFCGATAHAAKLTREQVSDIRRDHVKGCPLNGTMAQAVKYGVSASRISNIIHGHTYKDYDNV